MYDSAFDTDWDDLDRESALERAFALGVARSLGDPDPEEYDRLKAAAETAYERSLIELSYEEGRRKAAGRTTQGTEEVWEDLVVDPDVEVEKPDHDADTEGRSSEGPPGMTERPDPKALPEDGLDRLRLPAFLRRR
jgi:hypothetical protein